MTPARTRLAPSPTGFIHIGTLRTALFDYFLAKQTGGEFILRIEDTDQTRLVAGALESLLRTFKKLGIEPDEGPRIDNENLIVEKGDCGPYVQSARLDIYKKYVDQLLKQKDAYHCFCSKERLEGMREQQRTTKQTPKYDRHCLNLSGEEVKARIEAGEQYVVRMKVPEGETIVDDVVRGSVKFQNADIDDQVILKSDGFPTYHLAVVIDDALMKITHVIRGEEWLPSTPKHIMLFKMLGFDVPVFAHVPLLLNADKTKLSKRQGDVAVEDYLNKGYLPEALLNFIGTLGFNPTGDREIYDFEELIAMFDLSKVKKSGAVMNLEKLDWMNNQYLKNMELKEIIEVARPFVSLDLDNDMIARALIIERDRINKLDELQEKLEPYVAEFQYDSSLLVWKKSTAQDAKLQLKQIKNFIEDLEDASFVNSEAIEREVRAYIVKNELDNGSVLWPLRVALSGQEKSSSPFELLWVFGKEKGIERISKAIEFLG
ncbi:MAG: Glutamate-tRNA ligase [Candidatus Uhrbacteria bacterium GW2011_GWD2_41_121]|uniref:Glutamate--tRNA ligase n=1 Tax=Candidatus Uhrbacteria bacterium GW2011_GWC1_41_20 TaxID=1618983 RepID=A0A0G0VJT5_9BACT|nr:MAG: Glutamate-tRNA ligase [Candidatus Uhrbacteria bacterium GW2011_GWE1_39_46]KKR64536.1 MAG: Glutamate-tRNA ligase [Candidatus Uhrbacteria bacterium GW2011_GWC2_40_450]KKR90099.1 MAG: Glutamate-tRNA ligase [Candidatus Uhrbacteria bacterium GW2011_GWE2_41_1153]KKR90608.1 MAG: Glutamate-tRNA ligase [Candidatus Uhrbacteria bacterium GW2011_GWD2_41_121]KKR96519.1 MAG: Glutamate-tRNA ligase [Candidatus Uhrbacteria bacterium GW2011_GWD1_41_16]KKR99871.1 MAG: Glutamate-tRNA ligase [Candidatus Uh